MEREEVRAKLFESLIANKKYLRELERLRKENLTLKRMPLFLATVVEMGEDYVLLRQHGNNQEFITTAPARAGRTHLIPTPAWPSTIR